MAWATCASTSPPISSTRLEMPDNSASNWVERCLSICSNSSAEAAGDVVLGVLLLRLHEELGRGAELDQVAEVHVGGVVRAAGRLLHVVRDDHDRVVGLQFVDQFFDLAG